MDFSSFFPEFGELEVEASDKPGSVQYQKEGESIMGSWAVDEATSEVADIKVQVGTVPGRKNWSYNWEIKSRFVDAQRLQKLIYLHLSTDCFMKISQSTGP